MEVNTNDTRTYVNTYSANFISFINMNYSQSANENATNSELDSKVVVNYVEPIFDEEKYIRALCEEVK